MSLVEKFKGKLGDLVIFSREKDRREKVGYVKKYSHDRVELSNGNSLRDDGSIRTPFWLWDADKYETIKLKDWDSYRIKESFEQQQKRLIKQKKAEKKD